MNKFSAFNNNLGYKNALIASALEHQKRDEYIAGTYSDEEDGVFRGCSVGCSIYDVVKINGLSYSNYGNHSFLADQLNVPVFLTQVQDTIFEGLPEKERLAWTPKLYEAIPVGADLSLILPKFLKVVLESCLEYVNDEKFKQQKDVVLGSIKVIDFWLETGEPVAADAVAADAYARAVADSASNAAAAAARAADAAAVDAAVAARAAAVAARAAADAAAYAADAAHAAAVAARAAADAAAYAADAAHAAHAAAVAARNERFVYFSKQLLTIISEC